MPNKEKKYGSGFRTPEGKAFYYKHAFFRLFLEKYPKAIEELEKLLPLIERVFGEPGQSTDYDFLYRLRRFDSQYLLPPDQLLLHNKEFVEHFDNFEKYGVEGVTLPHTVPHYISYPSDSDHKLYEEYHKRILETSVLYSIAEIRAAGGDGWLAEYLLKRKEQWNYLSQESSETRADLPASNLNNCISEEERRASPAIDEVRRVLDNYWTFYRRFHEWLEQYCLQKHWLRRSFFLSLRNGLEVIWPDIELRPELPPALIAEAFGDPEAEYFPGLYGNTRLPSPKPFYFEVKKITFSSAELLEENLTWNFERFQIYYPPQAYLESCVQNFEWFLEEIPVFDLEEDIVEYFSEFLKSSRSDLPFDDWYQLTWDFRKHVRKFPEFKGIMEKRKRLIEEFRRHMEAYLDPLIPIIGQHLSNIGRRPKFIRIEWLLWWNIEQLTAREIVDKFVNLNEENPLKLNSESTFRKARATFVVNDLPVRLKSKTW